MTLGVGYNQSVRGVYMSLTIELTPQEEARLAAAAQRDGLAPGEVVRNLLTEHLPPAEPDTERDPMRALLSRWKLEDAAMTPDEVAEENRLWEEFKTNINAERDRARARRVF
jgi:hypothetical protein